MLKGTYDTKADIPEGFDTLYAERDGKFELTGIEGVKTQGDVDRVQEALRKEREDHDTAKKGLKAWGDLKPDEVRAQLDRIPELEAAAEGGADEEKIAKLVEGRLNTTVAPLKRELEKANEVNAELTQERDVLLGEKRQRILHDEIRRHKGDVLDTAMEDALMLGERMLEIVGEGDEVKVQTRDGVGVTPGVGVDVWLSEMQDKRPHWWPPSSGGGGKGGGGTPGGIAKNPWSKDHFNLTEQGRIIKEQGIDKARQYAAAAGAKI